ncbi:MAG: nucleotide exchange factor GrpE [Cyanobacteria bacterium]|nr:nucleotide exchange factor GrpE [Cyanobacteriota bacterium]MDW8200115.1 nucleotide exchange factor GrpE [Cyanobacteriota bacterium SKYGB_h_bin112]
MSAVSPSDYEDLGIAMQQTDALPVVNAVNRILAKALSEGADEVHIEPQPHALDVNFRKHGTIRPAFSSLPAKVTNSVINRIKSLAMLNTGPYRANQVGRIRRQFQGRRYDLLVSTSYRDAGECILMKVMNHDHLQPLAAMIIDPAALATLQALLQRPRGLILVVGAPGSGKSTTLAAMVLACKRPGAVLATLEHPIKYPLEGVIQTEWNPSQGRGFAEALQTLLSQNPQVLMVSNVHDRAAMISAISVAQTRLVLAALPVDDLPSTFTHLRNLGIDMSLVTQSLLGIVHQRLLPQLCPDCCQPQAISEAEIAHYGLDSLSGNQTFRQATTLDLEALKAAKADGSVCTTCNGAGYIGQFAIHEVLAVTDRIATLLAEGEPSQSIYEVAVVQEKLRSLYSISLELAAKGQTTLADVARVTFSPDMVTLHRQSQQRLQPSTRNDDAAIDEQLATLSAHGEVPGQSDAQLGLDAAVNLDEELPSLEQLSPDLAITSEATDTTDLRLDDTETPLLEVVSSYMAEAEEDTAINLNGGVTPVADDELPDVDPEMSLDSFELSDEAEAELERASRRELPREATANVASSQVASSQDEIVMLRKQLMDTALAKAELQQALEKRNQELKAIQEKVQQLEQDKADLKQQLVREREELARKFDRQKEDLRRKAKKDVISGVLEAIDSFEQAHAQLSDEERESSVHKGYGAIYRLMVDRMKKAGVVAVEALGKPFNPEVHEAVMMEESTEYTCDTVVGEFRRGYMMDDIILRPAQVKVAVPSEASPSPAPQPEVVPPVTQSSGMSGGVEVATTSDQIADDPAPVSVEQSTAAPETEPSDSNPDDTSLDAMFNDFYNSPDSAVPIDEIDKLLADL